MTANALRYKTCQRWNIQNHAHFLTFSCFQRQPFLLKDRPRIWLIDSIRHVQATYNLSLWAWVIMPEHVHLIICPCDVPYNISSILKSLKLSVARRAIHYIKEQHPSFLHRMTDSQPNGQVSYRFWQRGGGYDRNLWSSKEIWEKIDYCHNNPVNRGLCVLPTDWEWSSALDYAGKRKEPPLKIPCGEIPWRRS